MTDVIEGPNVAVNGSLASATVAFFSNGDELTASGATPTVRVGFSGAICDLDEQGRLKAALPLLDRYCELKFNLSQLEMQRRQFFDPFLMPLAIRKQRFRGRGVSQWLIAATRASEKKKNKLEKASAEIWNQLGAIDPRLIETDEFSSAPVATVVPKRVPTRKLQKLPPKIDDFSQYWDLGKLTDAQREVAELLLERRMSIRAIARYRGTTRAAVQYLRDIVRRKVDAARDWQASAKRGAARAK